MPEEKKRRFGVYLYDNYTMVFNEERGGVIFYFEGTDDKTIENAKIGAGRFGLMQAALKANRRKRAHTHRDFLHGLPGIQFDYDRVWVGIMPDPERMRKV